MSKKDLKNKSKAKAIGVKATFVYDDKIAISSFAQRQTEDNEKVPNVEIVAKQNGEVIKENQKLFSAKIKQREISVSSKIQKDLNASYDNPTFPKLREDYIGIKGAIEEKYFGKQFPNDNIRVQIAYNIADIKKSLALYANNIVYMMYNLHPNDKERGINSDHIGMLFFPNSYSEQIKFINSVTDPKSKASKQDEMDYISSLLSHTGIYNMYFDNAFSNNSIDESYNTLRIQSMLRQLVEHNTIKYKRLPQDKLTDTSTDELLFSLDKMLCPDLVAFLNKHYQEAVEKTNKDFIENHKKHIYVLNKLYGKDFCIDDLYRLQIVKDSKNLGVNARHLREVMLEKHYAYLKEKEYDSYRKFLYAIIDFIAYKALTGSQELLDMMVTELRLSMNDEGKEAVYQKYASILNEGIENKIKSAINEAKQIAKEKEAQKGNKGKKQDKNQDAEPDKYTKVASGYAVSDNVKISADNTSAFVKLMFFVTKFLDGKEINDLLTSLISRFENVSDLIQMANECGQEIDFKEAYDIFEDADKIADELKLVKSFARMKDSIKIPQDEEACIDLYIDAISMLSVSKQIVAGTPEYEEYKNRIFKTPKLDKNGNAIVNKKTGQVKYDDRLKKFIANNVINSKWFFYIARYYRPSKCARLMKNRSIIRLVLNEMPNTQLERYYPLIAGREMEDFDKEIAVSEISYYLANSFSVDGVIKGAQTSGNKEKSGEEKQRSRAIVGLYLTVVYRLIKNLVIANTRFGIAFSCLERDSELMGLAKEKNDYLAVTRSFVEKDSAYVEEYSRVRDEIRDSNKSKEEKKREYKERLKPILSKMHYDLHSYHYVKNNVAELEALDALVSKGYSTALVFRNKVMHLNVINDVEKYVDNKTKFKSYYGLYCYALQGTLFNGAVPSYEQLLKQNSSYVRDAMWVINAPFAYNLARYKSLSVENIFNLELEEKEQKPARAEPQAQVQQSQDDTGAYSKGQAVVIQKITKKQNGLYGYIANTNELVFIDTASMNEKKKAKLINQRAKAIIRSYNAERKEYTVTII